MNPVPGNFTSWLKGFPARVADVLLVCPEPLGRKTPAGVGIRFLEFARTLDAAGLSTTLLSPDGFPPGNTAGEVLNAESIARNSRTHAVAILQGHVVNDFYAHAIEIPTVIDLYDPYLVENLHYSATHGRGVFEHDLATLRKSIQRGDFFLTASEFQRLYYAGMMTAEQRINPDIFAHDCTLKSLLSVVPFGVPPPRQISDRTPSTDILFGGIYDWYDPFLALEAVKLVRREIPGVTITFNVHPNETTTPQQVTDALRKKASVEGLDSLVRFEPWVPYESRASFYDRFALSLLTFQPSLETDLAMRTRLFDFLWGGLPVITSSAQGTDRIIERYRSGAVCITNTPIDFAALLLAALRDPQQLAEMRKGAQVFTLDHQWSAMAAPLIEFCRTPEFDRFKPSSSVIEATMQLSSDFWSRMRAKVRAR